MQVGIGAVRLGATLDLEPRMSSSFGSSTSSKTSNSSSSHPQQHYGPGSTAADEEDLLALLSSDTFSLESQRDRDLVHLGSFLTNIIPQTGPQPIPLHPSSAASSSSSSHPWHHHHHHPWNDHSREMASSPMSFQSNSSGGGLGHTAPVPPAPSSSLNNSFPVLPPQLPLASTSNSAVSSSPPPPPPPPVPPVPMMDFSNFNGFGGWGKELEGVAGKESSSFNQSRWNTPAGSGSNSRNPSSGENTPMRRRSSHHHHQQQPQQSQPQQFQYQYVNYQRNCEGGGSGGSSSLRNGNEPSRVPNCSRERGETILQDGRGDDDERDYDGRGRDGTPLGKERNGGSGGRFQGAVEEQGGWKTRLRKSTVDQQQPPRFGQGSDRNELENGYDHDYGGNTMYNGTRHEEDQEEEDDLMMDD